jgi:hypothetical protein
MTRNVVLYELMSLDGFADDPGEGERFGGADARLTDFLADMIARQGTVLLGRRTFEKWAPHWPTSTMQPFADFINTTPRFVFHPTRRRATGPRRRSRYVNSQPRGRVTGPFRPPGSPSDSPRPAAGPHGAYGGGPHLTGLGACSLLCGDSAGSS